MVDVRISVSIIFCASQLLSKWWSHRNAQQALFYFYTTTYDEVDESRTSGVTDVWFGSRTPRCLCRPR